MGSSRPVRRPLLRSGLCVVALTGATVLASGPPAAAQGPEQIRNGAFDEGTTGWEGFPGFAVADGAGCNAVPAGTAAYSAAIRQAPIPIVAGETYALTFRAWAPGWSGADPVPFVRVAIQGGPEVNYAAAFPSTKLALTADAQDLEYTFTVPADAAFPNDTTLEFSQDISNSAAYTYCVDDVSLTGGAEPDPYEPETGPRVRVNQVAYLPDGPKEATVVTDATEPVAWQLRNGSGAVVAEGTAQPRGEDPTVGAAVQTVDFSDVTESGTGYTLVADGETSHPFDIGGAAYEQLRVDTKTFFHTNRSGIEISDALAPGYGRPAGHVGVPPNQGDTAVPCQDIGDPSQLLYDEPWTCAGTRDVSGGWYDAGDQGKYVVNGGIAVGQLLQEFERTKTAPSTDRGALGDGTLSIPEAGNGVPDLLDEARWELEWMLRMQVPAGEQDAGMVNHKVADVDWTGLPTLPDQDPQRRVLFRPSTAATLNVAAVAAQGARLFASYDDAFARDLLSAARTAYAAAQAEPALYAPAPDPVLDPNPGSGPYNDDDVTDEFYWAAAELYLTTGEDAFAADVQASLHHDGDDAFPGGGFDWGHVAALGRMDLATVPNELPDRGRVRDSVLAAADRLLADQATQPFGQPYAPEGGVYAWGSNSQILNNLQVIGTAYDLSDEAAYRAGVLRGMDYLLGRNGLNNSYVTGYGDVFSENQHSRWYAASLDPTLPHPPAGTVAGGPNSTAAQSGDPVAGPLLGGCPAQLCYLDEIGSWSTNEITVNWNAPMSWVSSFVADQDDGGAVRYASCTLYPIDLWSDGVTLSLLLFRASGPLSFDWTGAQQLVGLPRSGQLTQDGPTVTVTPFRPGRTALVVSFRVVPWGADWTPELAWVGNQPCRTTGTAAW